MKTDAILSQIDSEWNKAVPATGLDYVKFVIDRAYQMALEDAAGVCDKTALNYDDRDAPHHAGGAMQCAQEIRALMETAHEKM